MKSPTFTFRHFQCYLNTNKTYFRVTPSCDSDHDPTVSTLYWKYADINAKYSQWKHTHRTLTPTNQMKGPVHVFLSKITHTKRSFLLSGRAHCFESSPTLWCEGVKRRLCPRPWEEARNGIFNVGNIWESTLSRAYLAGGWYWHQQPSYRGPFISVWTCGLRPNPGRSRRAPSQQRGRGVVAVKRNPALLLSSGTAEHSSLSPYPSSS